MIKKYLVNYTWFNGSEWEHANLSTEITIEESELENWKKNFAGIKDNYDQIYIDSVTEIKDE